MNALPRVTEQLPGTQLDQFQVGRQGLPFVRRKRTQQMIAVQVGLKGQHVFLLSFWRSRAVLSIPVDSASGDASDGIVQNV
jgi:hypothetical protein